jgi:hypothetical protein
MQVVADVARIISQAEGVFGSRDKALPLAAYAR